jgi:hypothetical protein
MISQPKVMTVKKSFCTTGITLQTNCRSSEQINTGWCQTPASIEDAILNSVKK